jgi:hypothetical protein
MSARDQDAAVGPGISPARHHCRTPDGLLSALCLVANRWKEAMGLDVRYPARHAGYIEHCHAAGQLRLWKQDPIGT